MMEEVKCTGMGKLWKIFGSHGEKSLPQAVTLRQQQTHFSIIN